MARGKAIAVPGVYSLADYQSLRTARASLADLLGKIDKAVACGVDCSMYREMRNDIDAQLAAIQQHFMTPPPSV